MKKQGAWFTMLGVLAIVLLLCAFIASQSTSPITIATQRISDFLASLHGSLFEGFQTTSPVCPSAVLDAYGNTVSPKYVFFTDAVGESLCCAGTVNSLTHTCSANSNAKNAPGAGLCAFRPGVPDPRVAGQMLPLCSSVVDGVSAANGIAVCPPSLPKYAESPTQKSCCKTATNLDGTECIESDLQRGTFCRVNPPNGEANCATMKALETAVCPPSLQTTSYAMGKREAAAYPNAKGLTAPLCFGVDGSCFPDATVQDLRSKGVFTKEPQDPTKWKFACSGFAKYQKGEQTGVQTTYLAPAF